MLREISRLENAVTTERIADHDFDPSTGRCVRCAMARVDLIAYGHPDMPIQAGDNTGLSCSERQPGGSKRTNEAEIQSIREAWQREREKWQKMFS
jgi:hypothetical protein